MRYAEILHLALIHEYYGGAAPPIRVTPIDPPAFQRAGFLLRQTGAETMVAMEEGADDLLEQIELALLADTPEVITITEGADWGRSAEIHLPLGSDEGQWPQSTPATTQAMTARGPFARIRVALDHEGARHVVVRFQARQSHWAYHVMGSGIEAPLEIADPNETVSFEDLGETSLAGGRSARVLRSTVPLPSRARPPQRFSLQRPGPFGPQTLIPILPGAAPPFKNMPGDTNIGPHLQSDIFVSLFK